MNRNKREKEWARLIGAGCVDEVGFDLGFRREKISVRREKEERLAKER